MSYINSSNLLLKNIDFIVEECTMWMETEFSNFKIRSKKKVGYSKCSRDLNFIINALILDLKEDSDKNLVKIANKFWLLDKQQLFNIDIEIAVYDKMKDIILNYIFKNIKYPSIQQPYIIPSTPNVVVEPKEQIIDTSLEIENNSDQKIVELIEMLKNVLKHGKDKTRFDYNETLEKQKDAMDIIRRCQRNWDLSKPIPQEHIDHWIELLKNTPSPQDEGFFDVYVLTNKEIIKKLYLESWGYTRMPGRLSRNSQVNSPLLIIFKSKLSLTNRTHYFDGREKENHLPEKALRDTYASIGIASGLIAYSAAMLGYKTGFNRCVAYLGDEQRNIWAEAIGTSVNNLDNNYEDIIFSLSIGFPDDTLAYNETYDVDALMYDDNLYSFEHLEDVYSYSNYNKKIVKWRFKKQEYSSKRNSDKDIKINIIK